MPEKVQICMEKELLDHMKSRLENLLSGNDYPVCSNRPSSSSRCTTESFIEHQKVNCIFFELT